MLRPCAAVLRRVTLRALLKKNRDLNQLGERHNIGELLLKQETGCNCWEGHSCEEIT